MLVERSHKTFTALVVAATTAAIVFYSEQVVANGETPQQEIKRKFPGVRDGMTSTVYAVASDDTIASEGFCLAH